MKHRYAYALFLFLAFVFLFLKNFPEFTSAFSGPVTSTSPGAIGVVSSTNNISFGTTTPLSSTKLLIQAPDTSNTNYALRIHQPDGTPIFVVRNDGKIGIMTSTPSSTLTIQGDLLVTGNILTSSSLSVRVSAGSITPGVFNSSVSTSTGDYAFPAYLAVGTSTTTGIPAGLTLYGGGFLAQGVTGATPVSGAGTRMMWIPAKAAFRAGVVTGTQWDNASVGVESAAFGRNNTASGQDAFAAGNGAFSTGSSSMSLGFQTYASNTASLATGLNSNAWGYVSTAMGNTANALATGSVAIGTTVTANANQAMALGSTISVTGNYSLGIGLDATARTFSQANSMAIMGGNVGIATTSPDYPLDVEGTIRSTGISPTPTEGAGVELIDFLGTAGILGAYDRALSSNRPYVLLGQPINAGSNESNVALSVSANTVSVNTSTPGAVALSVNGVLRLVPRTSIPTSTNGMIYYDDTTDVFRCFALLSWLPNCRGLTGIPGGDINYVTKWTSPIAVGTSTIFDNDGTSPSATFPAVSGAAFTINNGSVLFKSSAGVTPVSGAGRRFMWVPQKAAFRAGYVSGSVWNDANLGLYSVATGYDTQASGNASFASGYGGTASGFGVAETGGINNVSGDYSFAYGNVNSVVSPNGDYAFAGGDTNSANGNGAVVFGNANNGSAVGAFVVGYNNSRGSAPYGVTSGANHTGAGNESALFGYGNNAGGAYSTAMGYGNNGNGVNGATLMGQYNAISGAGSWGYVLGSNNTSTANYAGAIGHANRSSGASSLSAGESNQTTANYAIALGVNNVAGANSAAAIGDSNTATGIADVLMGTGLWSNTANTILFGQSMNANASRIVGFSVTSTPSTASTPSTMVVMGGNLGIRTLSPSVPLDITTTGSATSTAALRITEPGGAGSANLFGALNNGVSQSPNTLCQTRSNNTAIALAAWDPSGLNIATGTATTSAVRALCAKWGS